MRQIAIVSATCIAAVMSFDGMAVAGPISALFLTSGDNQEIEVIQSRCDEAEAAVLLTTRPIFESRRRLRSVPFFVQ